MTARLCDFHCGPPSAQPSSQPCPLPYRPSSAPAALLYAPPTYPSSLLMPPSTTPYAAAPATAFPTPFQFPHKSGGADHLQKTGGTFGHSGSGADDMERCGNGGSILHCPQARLGTSRPLTLRPSAYSLTATVPLFCAGIRHGDLIFTRGRHRRHNWLPSNSLVCRRRRPHPQLPT